MRIKELQLLSEALWESIKSDLKFFSPIQVFVKKLTEVDYTTSASLPEIKMYADKIEAFFDGYRMKPGSGLYIPPAQASTNNKTVKDIHRLVQELSKLSQAELEKEFESIKPKSQTKSIGTGQIFIEHGRSKLWARLQIFLKDDLNLKTLTIEDESRTGEAIINILNEFLDQSSLAVLVMTAEDEIAEGKSRARQNVVHEAGLFQGRLGFDKVIILKQDKVEEFSNIAAYNTSHLMGRTLSRHFMSCRESLRNSGW